MSLIEKAEEQVDRDEAEELERKMRKEQFTLEDFLKQMKQVRKMGPLTNVLGMMPGMGGAMKELQERQRRRARARPPRGDHPLDDAGRARRPGDDQRARAASGSRIGSGTNVQAVNQLVKQFDQMRKLMKQLASGKMPDPQQLLERRLAASRALIASANLRVASWPSE